MDTPAVPKSGSLVAREIRVLEQIEPLKIPWLTLWRECPDATPFQTPQWLIPFYRHFAHSTPAVLTLYRGATLAGLLPLYLCRQRERNRFLLAGSGVSDYLDALIAPSLGSDWIPDLHDWIASTGPGCVDYEFQQLRASSSLAFVPAPPGWRRVVKAKGVCPRISTPDSVDGLTGAVPHAMRRQAGYLLRRAARSGPVTIRHSNAAELSSEIESLFALHTRRWRQCGEPGVFASKRVRAFFRDAWQGLFELGLLRLMRLFLGDWHVATLCGFSCRREFYYYIAGFDPDAARLSPGSLIVWLALQHAQHEGCHSFDFLRGAETYKYRWGAQDAETFSLVFSN
jgi:CelD/BcsL family acetyltransferase involved in cellulose biosynthesis